MIRRTLKIKILCSTHKMTKTVHNAPNTECLMSTLRCVIVAFKHNSDHHAIICQMFTLRVM